MRFITTGKTALWTNATTSSLARGKDASGVGIPTFLLSERDVIASRCTLIPANYRRITRLSARALVIGEDLMDHVSRVRREHGIRVSVVRKLDKRHGQGCIPRGGHRV